MVCANWKIFPVIIPFLIFISNVKGLESEKVVSGMPATADMFQHNIVLVENNKLFCGGALIRKDVVLTAAHCVYFNDTARFREWPYEAVAGSVGPDFSGAARDIVNKVYVPSGYKISAFNRLEHDIAVLKLEKGFEVHGDSLISTLNLPNNSSLFENKIGMTCGYGWNEIKVKEFYDGQTETSGYSDGRLRCIFVNILNYDECKFMKPYFTNNTIICGKMVPWTNLKNMGLPVTNDMPDTGGICYGDSGAALFLFNTVIGIVSSCRTDCQDTKIPSTYTRVSAYLDFINDAIADRTSPDIKYYKAERADKRRLN